MVRIGSRAPSTGLAPSALGKIQKGQKKQAYKIQYEQVLAKKKRLKIYVCPRHLQQVLGSTKRIL